jgi:hypothetical protein
MGCRSANFRTAIVFQHFEQKVKQQQFVRALQKNRRRTKVFVPTAAAVTL